MACAPVEGCDLLVVGARRPPLHDQTGRLVRRMQLLCGWRQTMRTKVFFLILISLSFSLITSAEEPSINGSIQADPTFQDSKGVAIRGYDPIAYFVQEKDVKGKAAIEYH